MKILRRVTTQSCPTLCDPMDCKLLCPWSSQGKDTRAGCHSLLPGIFLTQGSNPGLLHCRQTLSPLSHQGSPALVRRFRRDWRQEALSCQRWAVLRSSHTRPIATSSQHYCFCLTAPGVHFFLVGPRLSNSPTFLIQALPGALISFLECPLPMIS